MGSTEQEYKELFRAEALDNFEELNTLFTELEKNNNNRSAIDSIFRITHTLKGNAMGMGFEPIAELSHVMEDIFSHIQKGTILIDSLLFNILYRANDKLGELIEALKTDAKVSYKGIRTKLKVILTKATSGEGGADESATAAPAATAADADASVEKQVETKKPEQEEEVEEAEEVEQPKITFSDSIQIPVRKLDSLMNLAGELIIEKDRLATTYMEQGASSSEFARLQRLSSDLQYSIMDIRLVQIGFLFNKFHRIVRDVAHIESKKVNLVLKGTDIEIDRNILKVISDSLVHMVRNSVSHGIESPEERKKAGKPIEGTVTLQASNEKDSVIIEVLDDGKGIDENIIRKKVVEKKLISEENAKNLTKDEIIMYIFEPGFSSAEAVTEVSGRGVGMDVVKRATESIGGKLSVKTELGKGSSFILSLPSSMAVKGSLLFELSDQQFTIPLSYTEAVIATKKEEIHKVGNGLVVNYLDNNVSVVFLEDLFDMSELKSVTNEGSLHHTYDQLPENSDVEMIIVCHMNKYIGLVVDRLLQQKEIVEKTLSKPLDSIELVSGSTILGNGNVCLVLNVVAIINALYREKVA